MESGQAYGLRRLSLTLWQIGWEIGRYNTRKLMTELQLKPCYPLKFYGKSTKFFGELVKLTI
ncbi:hypothetical protein [Aggregatibacter kilianii]|uniref:hypothetical protein n=1 Tax=Aggregatibacter kilianii TaxID=2025884 RepID=UPI0013A631F5|nr:hypothetical protein [Aggregatibacter kilianii]